MLGRTTGVALSLLLVCLAGCSARRPIMDVEGGDDPTMQPDADAMDPDAIDTGIDPDSDAVDIASEPPTDAADTPIPDTPVVGGMLRIEPADHVLTLAPGASATVPYRVYDAGGADVTTLSTLSLDHSALGSFTGAALTTSTTRGGVTRVRATMGSSNGDTGLEVHRSSIDLVLGGAPVDAATRFGGAVDPSRAPSFVYPAAGTIVPPNLPSFEVHFYAGTGNDLFEVSFTGASAVVRVYTGCTAVGGGCVLTLDELTFTEVALAARGSGSVQIGLRGTRSAGGTVGAAPARMLGVASTELLGGIYYWTALSGAIIRFEFGRPGARPETYVGGGGPFACVGCHALSRDGRRIAVGRFIPGPATTEIMDVPTRTRLSGTFGANFESFSPDGRLLISSDGARLSLLDGTTGAPAAGLASGMIGSMPDWSPSGASVVFSRPATIPPFGGTPGHNAPADLMLLPWSGSSFGAATAFVTSRGENNFYPGYSPDGSWILFNRSAAESNNAIDAHLWVAAADGRSAPIDLGTADSPGDQGNSWPKWAPFVQTYLGEPLMWITFSSKRDYGLRIQQAARAPADRVVQLWMAAFRPNRAPVDPSAEAFWLPIQRLNEGNHIAQWAQEVRRHGCASDGDCAPDEFCGNGMCYGTPR